MRSDYPQLAANRYKYNGKEEQIIGDLEYLDYGARMYDSELGRWFNLDPRLEHYVNVSPYSYCGNNPIILVDVDGEYIDPANLDEWNSLVQNVEDKRAQLQLLLSLMTSFMNKYGIDDPSYNILL